MTSAPPAQEAEDYDAIHEAVMATARGRWFLAEHGRRNRHAETRTLLEALRRIERRLAGEAMAAPDLADLAAIFALGDKAAAGLDGEIVAMLARDIGAAADAIRDKVLSARGALKSLEETHADARLCAALDRIMRAIDERAAAQEELGRKVEALAPVIAVIRERLQQLVASAAQVAPPPPAVAAPPGLEIEPPAAPQEAPSAAPEPPPPFEGGLRPPPVGPGARLRIAIADEEIALREAAAGGERRAAPGSLAELDRMSYEERYALFAS